MLTVKVEILRINLRNGSVEPVKDEVVVEDLIELYVNDEYYATFSSSPAQIKELVVGHLLTEGIISKFEDIESLEISEVRINVRLTKKDKLELSGKPWRILMECIGDTINIPAHLWMKPNLTQKVLGLRLKAQIILEAIAVLNSQTLVFRRTGGTHASTLLDEKGKIIAFSEDISRHNAIDKVIGKAALKGADFGKLLLASTGRLTSEMAIKATSIGIPVVVSISAPTDKGIKIAEAAGLTLIGFARQKRFNIYAHPERIERPYT